MTERTYERLLAAAEAEVRAGRSVILDATFGRRAHRDRFRERFGSLRVRVRFLEAQATDEEVKRRLEEREGHPDEVSDARLGDFDVLTGLQEPPAELPAGERATVGTSAALEDTVTDALQALSRIQGEVECPSP